MTASQPYPNPPVDYPLVRLSELLDPPNDWVFLGINYSSVIKSRRLRRCEIEQSVAFHSWGFDMEIENITITKGACALWKLFYNQAEQHRPTSYEELLDYTRDAGPRLLSFSFFHCKFLPISRYYPHPPDPHAEPRESYVRPAQGVASIPDSYVEQMLYPASGGAMDLHEEQKSSSSDTESSDTPMRIIEMCSCGYESVELPDANARIVIEAVERAVMQFANPGLERHPSATPRDTPLPDVTAEDAHDLSKAIVASFPAVAQLKLSVDPLNPTRFFFDNHCGQKYPYRGRGPVWNNNSAAIDCVIVAGRLLDAGSTVIDRARDGWSQNLTPVQRSFIEATDINWDTCSIELSWTLRDCFWDIVATHTQDVHVGRTGPLWTIWNAATSAFEQFSYVFDEEIVYCPCMARDPMRIVRGRNSCVFPPARVDHTVPVRLQDVLSRVFAPKYLANCHRCGAPDIIDHRRIFRQMPARLVGSLDGTEAIQDHTVDMTFAYVDENGEDRIAVYRWLGGIYCLDDHFRLFWTETKRGEPDAGTVAVYDSTMCNGAIVGGVSQAHPDDKVPDVWWRGRPVPLLFYERIENPSTAVLNLAVQAASNMVNANRSGCSLLREHVSWRPTTSTTASPSAASSGLWDRELPHGGDRFHAAPAGYVPGNTNWEQTTPATATPRSVTTPSVPTPVPVGYSANPFLAPVYNGVTSPEGDLFHSGLSMLNSGFAAPVYNGGLRMPPMKRTGDMK
ncbi:hypothetical protein BDV59DRAFT_202499 [Aspergillus ambiguus]|uniref:uncharacterized protein n=1 Tax=Aspergillus ambiguus TaxID=176160 RepID=UPI003CCE364E